MEVAGGFGSADGSGGSGEGSSAGDLQVTEDFESGQFDLERWSFGGDADWFSTSDESQSGLRIAQAGPIDDSQSSSLILQDISGPGEIEFWVNVSSESGFDILIFEIDGQSIAEWSGEVDWEQFSHLVPDGTHTLGWTYRKASSASSDDDAAILDNASFTQAQ